MSNKVALNDVTELLRATRVQVAPATYVVVGMRHQDWQRLLEQPELSPRVDAPFMVLRDNYEVTLLIEEDDWRRLRHALPEPKGAIDS